MPTQAAFVEERYIRDLFCPRLSTILSTLAALPHVEVAQDFQAFVQFLLPEDIQATRDMEQVFVLLNDDGKGVNNAKNTAVGYRLAHAAGLVRKIQQLPADLLNVATSVPVDMPSRFFSMFSDAQAKLDAKPEETGNYTMDMVNKLRHVDSVINSLKSFVAYPLAANARTIYSPKTKQKYDILATEIQQTLTAATKQGNDAAKIIEKYSFFQFVAKHSKKCLDVPRGNKDDHSRIIQYTQNNAAHQQWYLIADGEGYYSIKARHSDKCLDVANEDVEDGVPIIQYAYHGGDNQKWEFLTDGDGYFVIVNKLSGKCLDVEGGFRGNDVPIIQYERGDTDNQKWQLVAAGA